MWLYKSLGNLADLEAEKPAGCSNHALLLMGRCGSSHHSRLASDVSIRCPFQSRSLSYHIYLGWMYSLSSSLFLLVLPWAVDWQNPRSLPQSRLWRLWVNSFTWKRQDFSVRKLPYTVRLCTGYATSTYDRYPLYRILWQIRKSVTDKGVYNSLPISGLVSFSLAFKNSSGVRN